MITAASVGTLVDTSVWVAFFRGQPGAKQLAEFCAGNAALLHPWVLGELLLGGLSAQNRTLLDSLDRVPEPSTDDLLSAIVTHQLSSRGIGLVDVAIVHAALSEQLRIWTFDKPLGDVAREVGISLADA
ncbi:MAG: type II toxin-antitoxin system VapC family toxin [Spirochaetaceae bacterium]|nr:MAG: type II toxin-antitoxin system VapC family toxin [Spirochaetaceae bacterium]